MLVILESVKTNFIREVNKFPAIFHLSEYFYKQYLGDVCFSDFEKAQELVITIKQNKIYLIHDVIHDCIKYISLKYKIDNSKLLSVKLFYCP